MEASVHVVHPGAYLQCTSYLIIAPDGGILVDPGCGLYDDDIAEAVSGYGLAMGDIAFVLLTHCHVDHTLGAHRYRRKGKKLVASPRAAETLEQGAYQVWYEYPEYVFPTPIDIKPADGETLSLCGLDVLVVHTPGHTGGCASYLINTPAGRAVFTGDILGGQGHPGWAGSEDFSEKDTLASLEKLKRFFPGVAFHGHGPVDRPADEWLTDAIEKGRAREWRLVDNLHPGDRPPPGLERPDRAGDSP